MYNQMHTDVDQLQTWEKSDEFIDFMSLFFNLRSAGILFHSN